LPSSAPPTASAWAAISAWTWPSALLIKGTFDHFLRAWAIGDTTIDAELKTWPSKLLAPIGLSFLWLRLLLNLVGYLRLLRDPDAAPVGVPPPPGAGHGAPVE
jgi:hypothetical protein